VVVERIGAERMWYIVKRGAKNNSGGERERERVRERERG
jgi:hypothetical protein